MNIDLVREESGDIYLICRETGERIQNVMISGYQIRQPHTDINSANGDRYRIMDRPTMQITLETTSDIQITQRAASQPPPLPQRNPFFLPRVEREVMRLTSVPGEVNRNGDSVPFSATINGRPATAPVTMREVLFGSVPETSHFRGERYETHFDRIQTPQHAGPAPVFDEPDEIRRRSIPPVNVRIGASVVNIAGLERVNFGVGEYDPNDGPTASCAPVSSPPSLFSDDEVIPSLSKNPASDEIVSTEEEFLAFDSANEVTQELIRMFKDMDMEGIAGLLLRASLCGRDFVSEAWSGFTSHLVSVASVVGNLDYEQLGFINLLCMMTPEEAWKCFTLNVDSKNWTEMQWDKLASRRIRDELSRSSIVCISPKAVENIESLDILA